MKTSDMLKESVADIRSHFPVGLMRDRERYAWWLSQTYHFVCHSTQLLGYALPFLKDQNLRSVYEHHLGEESRHDLLAIKDIEKLGLKIFPVSPHTEAFYQSQYYRIQFEGGSTLLGYILFLEHLAVTWGKEMYEELLPLYPQSVLFLRVHAEEDPSHVSRAIKMIEGLPTEQQEKILRNFRASCALYSAILNEGNIIKLLKCA